MSSDGANVIPAAQELAPRDRTVGIVFAESRASGCFEDRLSLASTVHGAGFTLRKGLLDQRPIVALLAGAAPRQLDRAIEALVSGHHPGWMIAAGLAHGLDDRLRRGDVLLADQIVDVSNHELAVNLPSGAARRSASEFPNWPVIEHRRDPPPPGGETRSWPALRRGGGRFVGIRNRRGLPA